MPTDAPLNTPSYNGGTYHTTTQTHHKTPKQDIPQRRESITWRWVGRFGTFLACCSRACAAPASSSSIATAFVANDNIVRHLQPAPTSGPEFCAHSPEPRPRKHVSGTHLELRARSRCETQTRENNTRLEPELREGGEGVREGELEGEREGEKEKEGLSE